MNKFFNLMLVCILLVGLAACGMTAENATAESTTIESIAITESVATEVIEAPPQITEEMLLLSHHCKEDAKCVGRGCEPWCEPDCQEHCGEQCILHVPNYVGLSVTCPSGKMWCFSKASSDEREKFQNLSLNEGEWLEVGSTTEFIVAGVHYMADGNGTQDPQRESDIPATTYEMGEWGGAVPISSDCECMGVVFLINPDTVQELTWDELQELSPWERPKQEFWAVAPDYIKARTGGK